MEAKNRDGSGLHAKPLRGRAMIEHLRERGIVPCDPVPPYRVPPHDKLAAVGLVPLLGVTAAGMMMGVSACAIRRWMKWEASLTETERKRYTRRARRAQPKQEEPENDEV